MRSALSHRLAHREVRSRQAGKFALDKQVPLDEEYTEEFVDIDGKQASVKVSRYNGKVLRVIPNDEISRNSGLTRDELMAKVVK